MKKQLLYAVALLSSVSLYGGYSKELIQDAIRAVKETGTSRSFAEINHDLRKFMLKGVIEDSKLATMSVQEVKAAYEDDQANCSPMGACYSWKGLPEDVQAVLNTAAILLPEEATNS